MIYKTSPEVGALIRDLYRSIIHIYDTRDMVVVFLLQTGGYTCMSLAVNFSKKSLNISR